MSNRKITDMVALTAPASDDVLPIVDISEAAAVDKNKKISIEELFKGVPDGTAAAPSIAFESDEDNGIFLAGTNAVGIATAGTQRVTFDASGNCGIGTTSPGAKLEVFASINPQLRVNSTSHGYLDLSNYSNGAAVMTSIAHPLRLGTGNTERMRIDSSGNVGIGTSHADFKLDVGGAIGLFESNNIVWHDGVGTRAGQLGFTSGEVFTIGRGSSGTESLRIDSSGNVGIGTSSPRALVDFGPGSGDGALNQTLSNYQAVFEAPQGTGDISRNIAFAVTTGGICAAINATDEGGSNATGLMVATGTAGAISEKLRITNDGNVGIGESNPARPLDIKADSGQLLTALSTAGNAIVRVDAADTAGAHAYFWSRASNTGESSILFGDPDDSDVGWIKYTHSDNDMAFRVNASERMRLDNDGRLLVGTSTSLNSAYKLQIAGENNAGANVACFRANATGQPVLALTKSRTGTIGNHVIVQNNDNVGTIQFRASDGSDYVTAASIETEIDGTPGSNDMPGRLVFSTTADGASSPTERMRISNTGQLNAFKAAGSSHFTFRCGDTASSSAAFVLTQGATGIADGTNAFIIAFNGNVTNTNNSYGSISDIKLKENIVDASSQWDDLKAIQVRNYNFIEGQTHTQIGVVAQEVELVSPGLVSESPDRDEDNNDLGTTTKSVNYSVLYMKAVKALQEAMTRIETLEQRLSDAGIA